MIHVPFTINQKLPEQQYRNFPAAFVYSEESPFEVGLALQPPEMQGEIVTWSLARELLFKGAASAELAVGEGAVRVKCCKPGHAVHIELDGVDPEEPDNWGSAVLHVPFAAVTRFLRDTYAIVPRGQESGRCDWDAEIAKLLS